MVVYTWERILLSAQERDSEGKDHLLTEAVAG
jgi:hypothetical protein